MDFLKKTLACRVLMAGVFLGGALGWGAQARATLLAPGDPATATPGTASLAGLTFITSQTAPFTGLNGVTPVFAGTLYSAVYKESNGNLDFAYQVTLANGGLPDSIHTVTISSYSFFSTDVDWIAGTGSVTYGTVKHQSQLNGNSISLNYLASLASGIAPGATADMVLVRTDATLYDNLGLTTLLDGGGVTVNTYEPLPGSGSGAPEPMSLSLLVVGGTALIVRRPRRANRGF